MTATLNAARGLVMEVRFGFPLGFDDFVLALESDVCVRDWVLVETMRDPDLASALLDQAARMGGAPSETVWTVAVVAGYISGVLDLPEALGSLLVSPMRLNLSQLMLQALTLGQSPAVLADLFDGTRGELMARLS